MTKHWICVILLAVGLTIWVARWVARMLYQRQFPTFGATLAIVYLAIALMGTIWAFLPKNRGYPGAAILVLLTMPTSYLVDLLSPSGFSWFELAWPLLILLQAALLYLIGWVLGRLARFVPW